MSEQKKKQEVALHGEVLALKERMRPLGSRVTELEKELREALEAAPSDL